MKAEKIIDPSDKDEFYVVFELGDRSFGIVEGDESLTMAIYYDHEHDGSGCSNLVLDGFGKELDLEFCSSRALTVDELRVFLKLEGDPFFNTGNLPLDTLRLHVSGKARAGFAEPIEAIT